MSLTIEVEQEADGRWIADVPQIPGVLAYGETREQAVRRVQALSLRTLAERLEHGDSTPQIAPVFTAVRDLLPDPERHKQMNLDANPTVKQVRRLLAQCDDRDGNHILWVTDKGEVRISQIGSTQRPEQFEQAHPEMRVRCETFQKGKGYVGLGAAVNQEWITELLDLLQNAWRQSKHSSGVILIGPL